MTEISGLYLESDAIDSQVLSNNTFTKARNAADSADVNILKVNADDKVEMSMHFLTPASAPSANYQVANKKYVDDTAANYIPTSQKGAASGVCPLNASSKIDNTYISDSILGQLEYKGVHDCSGGSYPSSPSTGYYYICSVSGTISGVVYTVGDWMVYNGSTWDKIDNTDAVASVFGRTGAITAATNDYTWAQIDKTTSSLADITTKSHTALSDIGTNSHSTIDTHLASTSNPHSVTKSQVGLGNVTNDAQIPSSYLDIDGTLAANSDSKVATQKAVKTYVDTSISGSTPTFNNTEYTMTADNITNHYFDCGVELKLASILVWPSIPCGPIQTYNVDWTHSVVSSKSRITFKAGGTLIAKVLEGHKITVYGNVGTN